MSQKQRTLRVGDEKIVIKSRLKSTRYASGWTVNINDKRYHVNLLTREEAEDHAYARWVKEETIQPLIKNQSSILDAYRRQPDAEAKVEDESVLIDCPTPENIWDFGSNTVRAEIMFKVTIGDTEFWHHGHHNICLEMGVIKGAEVE